MHATDAGSEMWDAVKDTHAHLAPAFKRTLAPNSDWPSAHRSRNQSWSASGPWAHPITTTPRFAAAAETHMGVPTLPTHASRQAVAARKAPRITQRRASRLQRNCACRKPVSHRHLRPRRVHGERPRSSPLSSSSNPSVHDSRDRHRTPTQATAHVYNGGLQVELTARCY